VVKRAVRQAEPNPDFALKRYVKDLVAEEFKNRRLRPPVQRRAASVPERAKQIGVGESTLEGEIREGRLEAIKVKARTLITDEAFDRWLATRERIKPKRAPIASETLEAT
jgi:excisionase family DNA binding protein